jgi:predicted nucleic acid-binding protein
MPSAESFSCVFDTSAVLAYLTDEAGAARVKSLRSEAAIPFMVYSELYYLLWQSRGKAEADNTYGLVKNWGLPTLFPNERVVLTAGRLKAVHQLGIADSYIAAFSLIHEVPLVSKDPDYDSLTPELKLLRLPR